MSETRNIVVLLEYEDEQLLKRREFVEHEWAHRWLVTSGRRESVYRSLAAAKKVAGKRGKITPLYK